MDKVNTLLQSTPNSQTLVTLVTERAFITAGYKLDLHGLKRSDKLKATIPDSSWHRRALIAWDYQ